MQVVLVAGTHSWKPDCARPGWWEPSGDFARYLVEQPGIELIDRQRPFVWSTDLDGGPFEAAHRDWRAGGMNLYAYIVPPRCPEHRVPPADTLVLCHSHGLQVALYAFAAGLQGALVSVAGPVRGDMADVAKRARPNITWWRHIHSDHSDWWQILGTIGDGRFGIYRAHPLADENVAVPDVGHSSLLYDPRMFERWHFKGWLTCPKGMQAVVTGQ
jgi:hypothetical protein